MSYERKLCAQPGCTRLGRNKGRHAVSGKVVWGRYCEKHHKLHLRDSGGKRLNGQYLDNSKCELCGWDKGPCDRHRKIPEDGYVIGNVVILCPNCHRLVSMNLLSL